MKTFYNQNFIEINLVKPSTWSWYCGQLIRGLSWRSQVRLLLL